MFSKRERDRRQLDRFAASFKNTNGLARGFIAANELWITPEAVFDVFPRKYRIRTRRDALNPEASGPIACCALVKVGALAVRSIGNNRDGSIRDRVALLVHD